MIRLKPIPEDNHFCTCGGRQVFVEYIWQGVHICSKYCCEQCNKAVFYSLPVNQSALLPLIFYPSEGLITKQNGKVEVNDWFSEKLRNISIPSSEKVEIKIETFKKYDDVLILNTLDFIYGHSFLLLLNLQRIIEYEKERGIIVLIQPMLRWLVPEDGVAEVWTVNLGFSNLKYFYPDLSRQINDQLVRFTTVHLSKGHLIPTNEEIHIEKFTGLAPYDFNNPPERKRITFIWRQDPDRLWIRNIYILKAFKKLGISSILLPFHLWRVRRFYSIISKRLGRDFAYTAAGLGRFGKLQSFIDDQRILRFDSKTERKLCSLYAESIMVLGVHGSSMLLPSAHAGMTVSLMPSKRWGNFIEDILFNESDLRLASYQRRVVPLNINLQDMTDIVADMVSGRDYFVKKFVHTEEL